MADNSNDKPFGCKEKGCLMKFANFDHLVIHELNHKKHKMCLKLNPSSATSLAIIDQTPSPSKILGNFRQNCEEVGLYHEIAEINSLTNATPDIVSTTTSKSSCVNPFAAAFGDAIKNNGTRNTLKTSDTSRLISDSPLNTPSVFPYNEGLLAIADAALNTPDHDYTDRLYEDNANASDATNAMNVSSQSSHSSSSTDGASNVVASESNDVSYDKNTPVSASIERQAFKAVSVICNANNLLNSSTTPTTMNQIPSIVITQAANKEKLNAKVRTTINASTITAKTNAIIAPKTKEAFAVTNANQLYKVILKLPDGRSVQLPLQPIPSISSIVTTSQSITALSSSSKSDVDSTSMSTNKDVIVNHINNGTNASQANQTSVISLSSLNSSKESLESRERALTATLASLPPRAKPGRKSKFAPEEDPVEKKARSLERNRAAAMRCRLKRKQWIDSLEEKADELGKINEKLQSEVVSLRREVTLLKTALLAHKDCPVTLQQLKVTNGSDSITTNGNGVESDALANHVETNGMT